VRRISVPAQRALADALLSSAPMAAESMANSPSSESSVHDLGSRFAFACTQ